MSLSISQTNNQYTCQFCTNRATKKCSKCKYIFYCSVECQRSDWKVHKLNCSPLLNRVSETNPFVYFTKFAKQFEYQELLRIVNQLNKDNPIYSVGSGNGAFEKFVEQLGFNVTCIDPNPSSHYIPDDQIVKKPEYSYLNDIETIEENATLFLIAPNPGEDITWDAEAIEKHPWKQIFLIFDRLRGSGGVALHDWLKKVEEGKDIYKIKHEIIKRAQFDLKDISTHNAKFSCLLLERGFQGEPVRETTEGHKIIYPPIKDTEEHNQFLEKMHAYDTRMAFLGEVINFHKAMELLKNL